MKFEAGMLYVHSWQKELFEYCRSLGETRTSSAVQEELFTAPRIIPIAKLVITDTSIISLSSYCARTEDVDAFRSNKNAVAIA